MDDAGKPEGEAGREKSPKKKAEDNPWYLLATLYGVPMRRDDVLQAKNRVAWNRYFAANLEEETNKAYRRKEAFRGRADAFLAGAIGGR